MRQPDAHVASTDWMSSAGTVTASAHLKHTDRQFLFRYHSDAPATISALSLRRYRPSDYRTAMSEQQLNTCGLKVLMRGETERWLVPVDADELDGPKISDGWMIDLRARINELRDLAQDEGLRFDEVSAAAALKLTLQIHATIRPSAFLLANGNIRLVWENDAGEQIGLQFTANGVQYVLLASRGTQVAQTLGSDQAETVMQIVSAVGLRHLLL